MKKHCRFRGVWLLLLKISSVYSDFFPITATQSGDQMDSSSAATNAVDNNPSSCSLAAENDVNRRSYVYGWLQVDLGNPFLVTSVTLTSPTGGNSQYLQNFVILVSSSNSTAVQSSNTCAQFNNGSSVAAGATIKFQCTNALIGRFVTIKRQGGDRQDAISICEVLITRNPSDWFIYLNNLPTNQSGAYDGQYSSKAVDGDVQSCAQPEAAVGSPGWWSIDLQKQYVITTVIIFNGNNAGSTGYAKEFGVWVDPGVGSTSRKLCYNYTGAITPGGNVTLNCDQPSVGQYVIIQRWGSDNTKTVFLCEIYIKGRLNDGSTISSTTSTSTSTSTSSSTVTSTTTVSSTSRPTSAKTSATTLSVVSRPTGGSSSTVASASYTASSVTTLSRESNSSLEGGATSAKNSDVIKIVCPVVIIGGLIILAAAGILLYFYLRKQRQRKSQISCKEKKTKQLPKLSLENAGVKNKPKPPAKPAKPSLLHQPIKANDLVAYVDRMKTGEAFKNEFKKLPEEDLDKVKVGKRTENATKNRFKNILPYDHTLVSLVTVDSDDQDQNYINANYITGYKNVEKMYIATQGPKVETLNDFWRMIWQENADLIVMTTRLHEQGKKKCEQYWPTNINEKKKFGNISVQLTREDVLSNHVYREMEIQDESKEKRPKRIVRQMHFLLWEDKQKPKDYLPVLAFRKKVRELQQISTQPIVIHCSAGVGRTGTYIALDTLLEQFKHEGQASFFKCVEDLRKQRMNMVQTWKQYSFLHEAVADQLQTGDTSIPCNSFAVKYRELLKKTPNGPKLEQQFELLQRLRDPATDKESAGNQSENLHKNRNKDIVAYDDSRLYLDVNYNESDYINAIYVEGLRSKEAFVLTQLPLEETIVDFWRLLWDHELKIVVLLDDVESNGEQCPKFFPNENATENYGPFTVTTVSVTEKFPSILLREFSVENSSPTKDKTLIVRQYQVKNWSSNSTVPNSPNLILPLINELLAKSSHGSGKPIVFQCIDGTTKSGLIAAAMHLAETIKEETGVDVFYVCRIVALNRPQVINSMDQYSFLHELASALIDNNYYGNRDASSYANVEIREYPISNENEYSNCRTSNI